MNFSIVKIGHISPNSFVESGIDLKAVVSSKCKKEVEKQCNQWYSLGAIGLSTLEVKVRETMEDYDTTQISVRQRLSIRFFDLLYAAREGMIQISKRKKDEDGFVYRTAKLVEG